MRIGDVVLHNSEGVERPAIVTHVHEADFDPHVDLVSFGHGSVASEYTSVPHISNRDEEGPFYRLHHEG